MEASETPYDNALVETVIGLFTTEVIERCGPWPSAEEVEFAVLEWVAWHNSERLLGSIGYVPPVERERANHQCEQCPVMGAGLN